MFLSLINISQIGPIQFPNHSVAVVFAFADVTAECVCTSAKGDTTLTVDTIVDYTLVYIDTRIVDYFKPKWTGAGPSTGSVVADIVLTTVVKATVTFVDVVTVVVDQFVAFSQACGKFYTYSGKSGDAVVADPSTVGVDSSVVSVGPAVVARTARLPEAIVECKVEASVNVVPKGFTGIVSDAKPVLSVAELSKTVVVGCAPWDRKFKAE